MAAKVALLVACTCIYSASAANCDTLSTTCTMPKPENKGASVECPATGCTVEFCCEYAFADKCDIQKLGCVKGNNDGWVPKTEEVAKAAGATWPPACESNDAVMCNVEDCCVFDESEKQATPTTTFTPWDSSASSSADQDSLESSYLVSSQESNQKDSSGSVDSSGSTASGSSGFFMKIYLWSLLAGLLACCLVGLCVIPLMAPSKKRAAKKPRPQPEAPPPAVEEELLLPPLVPVVPEMPVTTSFAMPMQAYAPAYGAYPMTTAAPAYGAYPMATPGYVV